jgi:hypothetical protein
VLIPKNRAADHLLIHDKCPRRISGSSTFHNAKVAFRSGIERLKGLLGSDDGRAMTP